MNKYLKQYSKNPLRYCSIVLLMLIFINVQHSLTAGALPGAVLNRVQNGAKTFRNISKA